MLQQELGASDQDLEALQERVLPSPKAKPSPGAGGLTLDNAWTCDPSADMFKSGGSRHGKSLDEYLSSKHLEEDPPRSSPIEPGKNLDVLFDFGPAAPADSPKAVSTPLFDFERQGGDAGSVSSGEDSEWKRRPDDQEAPASLPPASPTGTPPSASSGLSTRRVAPRYRSVSTDDAKQTSKADQPAFSSKDDEKPPEKAPLRVSLRRNSCASPTTGNSRSPVRSPSGEGRKHSSPPFDAKTPENPPPIRISQPAARRNSVSPVRNRSFEETKMDLSNRKPTRILSTDDCTSSSVLVQVASALLEKYSTALDTFVALDTDEDGSITLTELQRAIENVGVTLGLRDWESLTHVMDPHSSGVITYIKFIKVLEFDRKRSVNPEALRDVVSHALRDKYGPQVSTAFAAMDRNNDGSISLIELRAGLRELGIGVSDYQIVSILELADSDGNGVLDVREFVRAFPPPRRAQTQATKELPNLGSPRRGVAGVMLDSVRGPGRRMSVTGATTAPLSQDHRLALRRTDAIMQKQNQEAVEANMGWPLKVNGDTMQALVGAIGHEICQKPGGLIAAFKDWDLDGNGSLSSLELKRGLCTLTMQAQISDAQMTYIFQKAADGKESVAYAAFNSLFKSRPAALPPAALPPCPTSPGRFRPNVASPTSSKPHASSPTSSSKPSSSLKL